MPDGICKSEWIEQWGVGWHSSNSLPGSCVNQCGNQEQEQLGLAGFISPLGVLAVINVAHGLLHCISNSVITGSASVWYTSPQCSERETTANGNALPHAEPRVDVCSRSRIFRSDTGQRSADGFVVRIQAVDPTTHMPFSEVVQT